MEKSPDTTNDILREFPPRVREALEELWQRVSPELRNDLHRLLGDLAPLLKGKMSDVRVLLDLLREQYDPLLERKRSIALMGPVNAGKTTLFNHFSPRADHGAVSAVPGTTKENRSSLAGVWSLVDTPGADHGTNVGQEEREKAFAAASEADFIVLVFDASAGIHAAAQELYRDAAALGKPHVVALNKCDLVKRELDAVVEEASRALGIAQESVIPISALRGRNVERLLLAVLKAQPGLLHRMGEVLPGYRHHLALHWIMKAAGTAGTIAFLPLPFVDLIPLAALQGAMVLNVAGIYGYRLTVKRTGELISTFGAGLAGRYLFSQLSKFGGIPGWALSAAIASAMTFAMGLAAERWFATGERMTAETVAALARRAAVLLGRTLAVLGRRRPGGRKLREAMTQALEVLDEGLRPAPQQERQAGTQDGLQDSPSSVTSSP